MAVDKTECVFCRIIKKNTDHFLLYEDKDFLAFLDANRIFLGHSLVIPKQHVETFYDLPASLLKSYFGLIQKIGKAIEKAMHAQGTFIGNNNIVSQSVPHLHFHIIPRTKGDGLRGFFWPRVK